MFADTDGAGEGVAEALEATLRTTTRDQQYVVVSAELLRRARALAGAGAGVPRDVAGGRIPQMECVEVRRLTDFCQAIARGGVTSNI